MRTRGTENQRAGAGPSHVRELMRAGLLVGAVVSLPASVGGQERPQPPRLHRGDQAMPLIQRRQVSGADRGGILVEASAPVLNLFSRAEEGIARRDWKFVIDCLQRIIDDPEDSLMPRDEGAVEGGTLYESVRRRAIRVLSSLPPEGMRAYRLLFDGKAKGLYERGRAEHDPRALRRVFDRYLLTEYGDDATDLLASWALDEGRPGESVVLLRELLELAPGGDLPRSLIAAKLATAYLLLGRTSEAAGIVRQVRDEGDPLPDWLVALGESEGGEKIAKAALGSRADGSPAREVSLRPAVVDRLPWRFELSADTLGPWQRVGAFSSGSPLPVPVMEPVLSNERLFVRTPSGCVALDAADLSLVWHASPDASRSTTESSASLDAWGGESVYEDHVAGALAIAHGLVLAVEETPGGSSGSRRRRDRSGDRLRGEQVNRLAAYDAKTGAVQWIRGGPENADDPLSGVVFRHVPTAVGEHLWAPYVRQNDLFVAVLDPSDGAVIDRIGLGSLPRAEGGPATVEAAIPLTAADGVVLVPSGAGVVFAVDAADFHLRWAHEYWAPRKEESHQGFIFQAVRRGRGNSELVPVGEEEPGFVPTPPIVSGGLAVLAPPDSNRLLALSAAGGEFRWSVPAESWSYLIGADDQRVWVGGREVSCLSLSDGSPLWTVALEGVPTGRAIQCGGVIHVPLAKSVWMIEAETGEVLSREAMPPTQMPLGNLACSDTALFSVDPSSVRKLPDIERTIAWAHGRLEADERDTGAARELAWMYLLKVQPARAYELMRTVYSAAAGEADATGAVARIRVAALLAMARQADVDAGDALAWLKEARGHARTAEDRLRCSLAIAEQQRGMGDPEAELATLLTAGLSPEAEQHVALDELVQASARVEVQRRLDEVLPLLSADQRRSVTEGVQARLAEPAAVLRENAAAPWSWSVDEAVEDARRRLRGAAELMRHESAGDFARLTLADWHLSKGAYEQAEQLLFGVMRESEDAAAVVAAQLRLCAMYAEPVYGETGLLGPCLAGVAERFGNAAMPGGYVAPAPSGLTPGRFNTAGEWAAWLRSQRADFLDAGADWETAWGPKSGAEAKTIALEPRTEPLWQLYFISTQGVEQPVYPFEPRGELQQLIDHVAPLGPPRVTDVDTARASEDSGAGSFSPEAVNRILGATRAVVHAPQDLLLCLTPGNGDVLWHAALQLPDAVSEPMAPIRWEAGPSRRRMVADGQTAVLNTPNGLYAVGLVTGRRLWVRRHENPATPQELHEQDWRLATGGGYVAALPSAGKLSLLRLYDGSPVWERDLRGEPVDVVEIVGDRVVTQDGDRQRVHVFDLKDGRLIKQVLFQQPDLRSGVVSLALTPIGGDPGKGGCLCGPDSEETTEQVVGVDVGSGEELWRVSLEKPLVQLFVPQPGYIGIGLVGGDVRVVEAATGEVSLNRRVSSVHAVIDGRMHQGSFIVQAAGARREQWEPVLVGMDIATDTELWRRDDLSGQGWDALTFRVLRGVIPSLVKFTPFDSPQARHVGLALVDARTGQNRGGTFDLTPTRARNQYNGVFEVSPEVMLIGTGAGIEALPLQRGSTGNAE